MKPTKKNKKKNIVIVGDPNSVFIKDFISEIVPDYSIILRATAPIVDKSYYEKRGIITVFFKHIKRADFYDRFREYIFYLICILRKIKADIVIVHYSVPDTIILAHPFWQRASKRMLVFWGSDVRGGRSEKKQCKMCRYIEESTDLIFMNEPLQRDFVDDMGDSFLYKSRIIDFGMPLFKDMDRLLKENNKKECQEKFCSSPDKILVHIGYNAHDRQHHIDILSAISSLPAQLKNRLYLVIPFQYGLSSDEYLCKMMDMLDNSGLDGRIYTEYLDKRKTAEFRNACDIFVYAQEKDAGSESPMEYMYMGSRIIMPKWLIMNYPFIEETKYECYIYNDYTEIPASLEACITDIDNGINLTSLCEVREWMRRNKSWEAMAPVWRECIDK